jgi:hypothetical protein
MLTPIVPDQLWEVRHDLRLPVGIHFPGRMTVARSSGGLVLHSPVPIDAVLAEALEALGPVEHIVAPSKLHHLHVASAQQAFPAASTWGAPGLAAKRPDLAFTGELGTDVPFATDLEPLFIEGIPWMNETVFLHRPTRSLLVTDLFFDLRTVRNRASRLFFGLYGMLGRAKQSPLVWLMTRDRPAYRRSVEALLAWEFERAIPCHGELVTEDAQAVVRRVLVG